MNTHAAMEEFDNLQNQYFKLTELLARKQPCVLATVTETFGSTPQKPGSSAIFNKKGLLDGTVGGGLIEHQVQEKAKEAITHKQSVYCNFDLNDDILQEESVICGGGMRILIDASPEKHQPVFEALTESLNKRMAGVLVTKASYISGGELNLERFWITTENKEQEDKAFDPEIALEIKQMLKNSAAQNIRKIETDKESFTFLEHLVPLPRLIIAGAGHIGKALAHLGKLIDFEVVVWDDREDLANENNIPDADMLLTGKLDDVFGKIKAGDDTYVVIVTRGHRQD
ncbi:MAG: XdhC family protein, partial [Prolixibacteraceae bacterium]